MPSASSSCRAARRGARYAMRVVEKVVADEGQTFLGWRDVPVDNAGLGESVLPTEPVHMQAFIGRDPALASTRTSSSGACSSCAR